MKTKTKGKAKGKNKRLSGIEDVTGTAAALINTKMRYDYERSLTPQERQERYQDQKKTGAVLLGIASVVAIVIIAHAQFNKPKQL